MPEQTLVSDTINVEKVLSERYDIVVEEALKLNNPQKVLDVKWGRLFLEQTYGYTLD